MLKTKKAVAKRFKLTATGKLKFNHAGLRHCLGHRPRKNKRRLVHAEVASAGDRKLMVQCLPYGAK